MIDQTSPMPQKPEKTDAYAALRVPAYRRFLAMRLFMTLAIQIMSVSVGWQIYELTNSKLALGLIGLSEAIPAIMISLYAGHLADKLNRRNILVGCVATLLLCSLALLGLAFFRDAMPKEVLVGGIFFVIACTGISRGFFSPTNFAFLPQLVSEKQLSNAITWNSSTWELASITGLGLGGLLFGFAGIVPTYLVMSLFCLCSLFCILGIAPRPLPKINVTESAITRMKAGLSFVKNNPLIINTITLDLFAVLFGGAVALLPVYAKDILHVGPTGLGVLRAATALGALSMAFVIAHFPLGKGAGKLLLWCVAGFGLCMIGFGLSTNFWLSFAFLAVSGMLDEVSVFIRSSLVQHLTPNEMKGRVSAINSIFITSSNEIGAFESGLAAQLLGTVPSVVFGGLMTIGVVGMMWWQAPSLRLFNFNEVKKG
jgi:MFS family permease